MTCEHKRMDFKIDPHAFEDTNVRRIGISVSCKTCKARFRFLGLTQDFHLDQPLMRADGLMAFFPVVEEFEEVEQFKLKAAS